MAAVALSVMQVSEPVWPKNPAGPQADPAQCVSNISQAERLKRLRFGVFTFVFGLGLLAVLLVVGAAPVWRLALLPVFCGAGSGFFQWRNKT